MESALREGGRSGVRLIETMLWDGAGFPRRALHMARLGRGADALGWAASAPDLADVRPDGPARVRLTLGAAGDVVVEVAPLPAAKAQWRVGLASARLASGDPWLTVKSTRRAAYDAARAALPQGLDEVVFANERGEVCDGTITTLFFDRGQGMRTPPLSCGVLPGVLRAEIACPEEVLMAEDLPRVRLWVGNALRGLIPGFICL
ncbi:aminotransferase class IV [Tabrizicola sp.]|uniref:aminotransferase class IV n=1 Tax=Tabrizicola sp. TaxID=2005166 RepID=UPI00386764E9